MNSMAFSQVLNFLKRKDYSSALKILRKNFIHNPFDPLLYFFFFVVLKRKKKYPSALKWLREGFHACPDSCILTQFFAYYTVVWKKDPGEALLPLSRLTENHRPDPFTHLIFSRYYEKKRDLERALFYAQTACFQNPAPFFCNRYFLILFRLRDQETLAKFDQFLLARRLSGKLRITDISESLTSYEKFGILQKKGIILLNRKIIKSPLFCYWLYYQYGFFLPGTPPEVKIEVWRKKGKDILKEWEKKKQKKSPFPDENFLKIIAGICLAALLFYLLRGAF